MPPHVNQVRFYAFLRICICENKKTHCGPIMSVRASSCLCPYVLVNHWTILNQILGKEGGGQEGSEEEREGYSLWPRHPAVLVLFENTFFSSGNKYRCCSHFGLMGSVLIFACIFFCLPAYFLLVKMLHFCFYRQRHRYKNRKSSCTGALQVTKIEMFFIARFCIFTSVQIKKAVWACHVRSSTCPYFAASIFVLFNYRNGPNQKRRFSRIRGSRIFNLIPKYPLPTYTSV